MSVQSSGISLNAQRYNDTFVLNLKPSGQPSDEDFAKLKPMLEAAVYTVNAQRVSLLVDLSELKSMSAKSAWNEFLHGLKIGSEFDRIAVFGQRRLQRFFINAMSWLISPNLKVFKRKEEAANWVMIS